MSKEYNESSNKQYYQVYSGAFRRKARPDEEAIVRVNKLGKEVREMEVTSLSGLITSIAFEPSDYGQQLKIQLDPNEKGITPVLTFGVESKDGRDIIKKLPALDLTKEVKFSPYRFEDDAQTRSGITLYQGKDFTTKILNFFFDTETKKFINGYPTINWDEASESAQKIYKIQRDEFLVEYTKQNILPKFSAASAPRKVPTSKEEQDAMYPELTEDDMPTF